MRIDYSPPKQSYVSSDQSKPRPRKEPTSLFTSLIVVAALIAFGAGFATGWLLSERSTKKAFQAATEQTSLESSPKPAPAPPRQAPTATQQPAAPSQPAQATATTETQTAAPSPQLSFYKTLPDGQKSTMLGSGINKGLGKQPVQAAIPSNVVRRQQDATTPANPQPEKTAPAEKPAATKSVSGDKPAPEKPVAKARSGYTVQVASYNLKSEAEAMRNKLSGKGYNASISESNQGSKGIWYRVRVGRKMEQEAARELAGKIGKGAIAIPE